MCEMCSLDSYLRQMGENVGDVIIRLDSYLRQMGGENVGDVIIRLDSYLRQIRGENVGEESAITVWDGMYGMSTKKEWGGFMCEFVGFMLSEVMCRSKRVSDKSLGQNRPERVSIGFFSLFLGFFDLNL